MDIKAEINKLSNKVDKLTDDVHKIQVIEEKQKNYENVISELKVEIGGIRSELPSLNAAIAELTNVLSNMTGKAEGAASAKKAMWAVIGSFIIAGVIGISTTIISLREEVAVLKNEIASIREVK